MIEDLRVYPERMRENLEADRRPATRRSACCSRWSAKGVARQEAYVYVQRNAMKVWEEKVDFRTALKRDPEVARGCSATPRSDACFALDYHLNHVDTIFRRVFGEPEGSPLAPAAWRRQGAPGQRHLSMRLRPVARLRLRRFRYEITLRPQVPLDPVATLPPRTRRSRR